MVLTRPHRDIEMEDGQVKDYAFDIDIEALRMVECAHKEHTARGGDL